MPMHTWLCAYPHMPLHMFMQMSKHMSLCVETHIETHVEARLRAHVKTDRMKFQEQLGSLVHAEFPSCTLELFGSSAAGTWPCGLTVLSHGSVCIVVQ